MNFERGIQRADELEQVIHDFRAEDELVNSISGHRIDAVEKLYDQIRVVADSYKEAFSIYFKLQRIKNPAQKQEAEARIVNLLNELLDQSSTGHWRSSTLQMQILLSIEDYYQRLEDLVPGAKAKIHERLYRAIHYKLSQYSWIELPLMMDAIRLMRKLSGEDGPSQIKYSTHLCYVMELIAKTSAVDARILEHSTDRQGSLANAIHWYEEAAKMAQSVDIGWAEYFTARASELRQILHSMPPEPLFSAPLGAAIARSTAHQHQEDFLPTSDDLIKEYESVSDKLVHLITDQRFHLDEQRISEWMQKHPNSPLKEWTSLTERKGNVEKTGGRTIDNSANPVGITSLQDEFKTHFVREVERNIGALFHAWIENGELNQEHVYSLLERYYPQYDWGLFTVGMADYFEHRYVSALHILIPQFEGVCVSRAVDHGIEKKIRAGDAGELYLSDLVKKPEFQQLMGMGFSELIFWYMVNRNVPQFNIRNNVAHGFASLKSYDWKSVGAVLIWMTLKVVSIPIQDQS